MCPGNVTPSFTSHTKEFKNKKTRKETVTTQSQNLVGGQTNTKFFMTSTDNEK
jgi:hypothetical protein